MTSLDRLVAAGREVAAAERRLATAREEFFREVRAACPDVPRGSTLHYRLDDGWREGEDGALEVLLSGRFYGVGARVVARLPAAGVACATRPAGRHPHTGEELAPELHIVRLDREAGLDASAAAGSR